MMNDKEILYSVLDRYIDNLLVSSPALNVLSGPIKRFVFNYIDPYVNLFLENDTLQVDMASGFIKKELTDKIADFKKLFKETKDEESN